MYYSFIKRMQSCVEYIILLLQHKFRRLSCDRSVLHAKSMVMSSVILVVQSKQTYLKIYIVGFQSCFSHAQ